MQDITKLFEGVIDLCVYDFCDFLSEVLSTLSSGGSRISHREGHGPPMWALFGENVCENERIGSHRGVCTRHAAPRSANALRAFSKISLIHCFDKIHNLRFSVALLMPKYMSCHRDGGRSQGDTRHSLPPARRWGGFNFDEQLFPPPKR